MQIVLNADDFGASSDTLAATIECFEAGLLTSASVMVDKPATTAACAFARAHPQFSFGVHLVFVGDGSERPLTDPQSVRGLVNEEGALLPTNVVRLRGLLRRIPVDQIEREIEAQIDYVRSQGVPVAHVDSHRHLHKYAPFREALRRALPRFGITRVRNVQDVYLRKAPTSPTWWAGRVWRRALMQSFVTTEHFYMPTSSHDHAWHTLANKLPRGCSLEVGLHPGEEEAWRRGERSSLVPFVEAVRSAGHDVVTWNDISIVK